MSDEQILGRLEPPEGINAASASDQTVVFAAIPAQTATAETAAAETVPAELTPAEAAPPATVPSTGAVVRQRRRTLLVIAGVAVLALLVGLGAGQFIRSPADAASRAEAPAASVITVPVERRSLETQVSTRGDVAFAGSVEVELEFGELATPPVVTGHVPERGDELTEGEPLLEVVGRPVIALQGELPMYRSLRPGMSGPDVVQLKETLRRLGFDPGPLDQPYNFATGQAVTALFQRAGYPPPAPDEEAAAELSAAQQAVDEAEDVLSDARDLLTALEQNGEADPSEIAAARSEVDRASDQLDDARVARGSAQAAAGTPLPAAEVYYLPTLPRRIDEVRVARGEAAEGPVLSVSGADLQVTARVNEADRALLTEEMSVLLDLPDGSAAGTIVEIREADGEDARGYDLVITPDELTPEQADELVSSNIRVVIPIGSTEGEVLAVPLAALTAGPGGESRVEVWRDGESELVVVEVGLVAQGYAEVTPVSGTLTEADVVAVGEPDQSAQADDAADEAEDDEG